MTQKISREVRVNELIRNLGDIAARFDISETEARRIAERATTEDEFIAIWENENFWADDSMTQKISHSIEAREVRALLGQHYEKVRITRDGEVRCYGRMPNSIETGWFLYSQSIEGAKDRLWG